MFGIDSPELLVIAIVALVVIGPKELPGLLKTWGKWMSQMRGMASEFRGHVDEMVRQSELDEVKKQLTDATGGVDLKSLDPTKQIRETIQEGMAEGEKALAEAKSSFDQAPAQPVADTLAEPESAPQIAAEPAAETAISAPEGPAANPVIREEAQPAQTPADPAPADSTSEADKQAGKPTQAAAE